MNPDEPVVPDPDIPVETPMSPVEEPLTTDDIEEYKVIAGAHR
jgi:hypothetical protein